MTHSRRWMLGVATLLAILAAMLLMRAERADETPLRDESRTHAARPTSPVLEGGTHHPSRTTTEPSPPPHPQTTPEKGSDQDFSYSFRIGDHRALGVEGVRVSIERDSSDLKTWRVLAEGSTNIHGIAKFTIPGLDHVLPKDGLNLRIRVSPPPDRDDLIETWKLWKPTPSTLWDLDEMHVVAGQVLDSADRPVAGATIAVGTLSEHGVVKPQWQTTTSDDAGRWVVRGLPTTPDRQISIWAVAPGVALPERSSEIQGAVGTALGNRGVTVRVP